MIRCSSIHAIMTEPSTKKAREAGEWSQTAITAMMGQVRELVFGVRKSLDDVKCIQKGNLCEDAAIELYNSVFLYNLEKLPSDARRDNGIITGEPDLLAIGSQKGVDIKNAWSLLTFPMRSEDAAKKEYEWQARGYMHLFDVPKWEIAYCFIDTPDELLKSWDDRSHHYLPPEVPLSHRVTIATYERDMAEEERMLEKCKKANVWIEQAVKDFITTHNAYEA